MEIAKTCMFCRTEHKLNVSDKGYADWRAGKLIQHALPELSFDDRELLISGICGKCFDNMFKED